MTELLTSDQMRALEGAVIASGAGVGLALMERAGRGVVDHVFETWPEFAEKPHRALVLCGPGNNGGDGFVIGRLLQKRGWEVDLHLFGDPEKLPEDAARNEGRWRGLGTTHPWDADAILSGPRPDLIVDAVFGIGLTRPLPQEVARVLDRGPPATWQRKYKIKTVAVDCPSGLNLDTGFIPREGNVDDPAFDPWPKTLNVADLTVTFHSPKPGHYLQAGPVVCGAVKVVDIGLTGDATERRSLAQPPDPERARLVEPRFMGRALPRKMWLSGMLSKPHQGHKFNHGHAVVFAGGAGRGGAARLAARGALRVGAGLVTVLCPSDAVLENACRLDAIMLRAVDDLTALNDFVDERIAAFCLGPGMGVGERTQDFVCAVLALERATVLDADALTSFEAAPDALFDKLHADTVLTPHRGEFSRLFPDLDGKLRSGTFSAIDILREASARAGCVVLLKGASTVIAEPSGGASVHAAQYDRQAPWLATAGAGDVLAGMIAGIAAGGASPSLFNAVEAAVWLHVEAARRFGPGLIAEDLPEALPKLFRDLGL